MGFLRMLTRVAEKIFNNQTDKITFLVHSVCQTFLSNPNDSSMSSRKMKFMPELKHMGFTSSKVIPLVTMLGASSRDQCEGPNGKPFPEGLTSHLEAE